MFAASKSGSFEATDAQFNYVTMLLHGDGTNGAQNNTFLDSSTNNFTITRNGNTTQGTFTPYGSNWSNYFGTSGQYLQVSDSTPLNLSGGSYTIECWVNPTGNYAGYNTLIAKRVTGGGATSWEVTLSVTTGYLTFYNGTLYASTTTPVANTWSHIAAVYDGTNMNLYVNGTRALQTAVTNSNTSASVTIANFDNAEPFFGYMSNVRVTKGAALYTGTSFTVPTSPLTTTVSAGTVSLLTCQSNRFIDTSVNAATVTVTGSPSVQRFSPFSPTTAYSTSVIGGSGYFDGSGDFLNTASSSAFNLNSVSWTIECYVYLGDYTGDARIWGVVSSATTMFATYIRSGTLYLGSIGSSEVNMGSLTKGQWYHLAFVNVSGTITCYINGVQSATTSSYNFTNTDCSFYVAATPANYSQTTTQGYISSLRVLKGTALYTTTFTPPTAPLTAITNTSLLLNYTNAGILDNAMMNDLETVGNAQISTSVKKYGTGSIALDGTGDWLMTPNRTNLNVGSGDFTVEAWVYTGSSSQQVIIGANRNSDGVGAFMLNLNYTGKVRFFCSYSGGSFLDYNVGTGTISDSAWHHIAVTRSGSSLRIFIDGTQTGTTNTTLGTASIDNAIADYRVGSTTDGALNFNGYIDDLRITRGVARYTANFTAPIVAFADKG